MASLVRAEFTLCVKGLDMCKYQEGVGPTLSMYTTLSYILAFILDLGCNWTPYMESLFNVDLLCNRFNEYGYNNENDAIVMKMSYSLGYHQISILCTSVIQFEPGSSEQVVYLRFCLRTTFVLSIS
jgi:hypothetical protein